MKLKIMVFLTLVCTCVVACHSNNEVSTRSSSSVRDSNDEVDWKDRFKNLMLCNCVLTGLADSTVRIKFLTIDKSFYDPINVVMEEDIKQALVPIIIGIKKDSVATLTTVGEGA